MEDSGRPVPRRLCKGCLVSAPELRYTADPRYRTKRTSSGYYLRHQNGARIKTDRVINLIWETAQGSTAAEIQSALEGRTHISSWLLGIILELMGVAELLRIDPAPQAPTRPEPPASGPKVSIIIVNKDGSEHLSTLLPSILRQDYPQIELVMVDNGSQDDSVELARRFVSDAKIIELKENIGFSAGNNVGIEQATGDYFFLLNNDTELADDAVSRLVEAAAGRDDIGAVVPKMFLWRLPRFLNGIGNTVRNRGWGGDNFLGHLDIGQFDDVEEVFSAWCGAVLIPRAAFERVGPLDPKYMFYYEDVDWSFRARLLGLKIVTAPGAAVFHKFSASMDKLEPTFKWRLGISNRWRFITKALSKGAWLNFARSYAKEDFRGFLRSIKHHDWPMSRTYLSAWWRVFISLPGILLARRPIQAGRVAADVDIFEYWAKLPPLVQDGNPVFDLATVRRIYVHALGARPSASVAQPEEGFELSMDA